MLVVALPTNGVPYWSHNEGKEPTMNRYDAYIKFAEGNTIHFTPWGDDITEVGERIRKTVKDEWGITDCEIRVYEYTA